MKDRSKYTKYSRIVIGMVALFALAIGIGFVIQMGAGNKRPIDEAAYTEQTPAMDLTEVSTEVVSITETEMTPEITIEIITTEISTLPTSETPPPAIKTEAESNTQALQSDVIKPTATPEQLTDPSQTPDGQPVAPAPSTSITTEPVTRTAETTAPNTPQAGDQKDGKIYVPGFGWIEDVGEGEGVTATDMYENGNKIGDMD